MSRPGLSRLAHVVNWAAFTVWLVLMHEPFGFPMRLASPVWLRMGVFIMVFLFWFVGFLLATTV
jgi:hypothetical protein